MQADELKRVTANGVDFAYFDLRPASGDGPVVLCLHGYPDTPLHFDVLAPRLVEAGFRVIAPYQRGYAPTSLSSDGRYGGMTLGEDVIAILDALEIPKARLVGHDWGAFSVYQACNMAADRFEQAVTLAIAHPRVIGFKPTVFIKAWHFLFYQLPWVSEWWLRRNDFAAIDALWRRWSPTGKMPPGETDAVKSSFRVPGVLEAALGYYRSLRLNPFGKKFKALNALLQTKTSVDLLALYGLDDGVLSTKLYEDSAEAFTGRYAQRGLPDCGHFLLRERPDAVCDEILKFFTDVAVPPA